MSDAAQVLKIDDAVEADIRNSVLCWLATVDDQDILNVTERDFAGHGDDGIVIADRRHSLAPLQF